MDKASVAETWELELERNIKYGNWDADHLFLGIFITGINLFDEAHSAVTGGVSMFEAARYNPSLEASTQALMRGEHRS